jgi:hypothetical protein
MRGTHRKAVERTIKAGEGRLTDVNAAVVELARAMADQVDAAGPEASSRILAAYLSVLKDLTRAIGRPASSVGKLASMRQIRPRENSGSKIPRRSVG